ncbi:MAG: hypothetical protein ACJAUM_003012 [Pseudomonadales bacterium]|jgi:hypothetical protein
MSAMPQVVYNDIEKIRFASAATSPQVLAYIYNEACNIAIWQRCLPAEFLQQLSQDLRTNSIVNKVLQIRADNIEDDIATIAQDRIYGEQLRAYIFDIVDMFCVLFDTKRVGLRLSVLNKAMCPRFHFDRVPCRLVTTFCGSGTQWLPSDKINPSKLGHASGGKSDEESGLMHKLDDIPQLSCGDVALLKGDTWEGNEGGALVHRSPALKPNENRLLMTIDFVA